MSYSVRRGEDGTQAVCVLYFTCLEATSGQDATHMLLFRDFVYKFATTIIPYREQEELMARIGSYH